MVRNGRAVSGGAIGFFARVPVSKTRCILGFINSNCFQGLLYKTKPSVLHAQIHYIFTYSMGGMPFFRAAGNNNAFLSGVA